MAKRVTGQEVKNIITTTKTAAQMTPFIIAANSLTNILVGKGLSAETLKEIERWLSAHFLASSMERQALMEKVGDTQVDYGSRIDIGSDLEFTSYGRNAKMLDTSGTLANLGKRQARIDTIEAITNIRDA